jgi:hypothetical protein
MSDLHEKSFHPEPGVRARSLQGLADEISDLTGARRIDLHADCTGVTAFSFKVRGTNVTVTHDATNPLEAWVHIFVGMVSHQRELEMLRALLQANMQMRSERAPVFGLDGTGRQVVLRLPYLLAAAGHDLLRHVDAALAAATRWLEAQSC